MYKLVRLYDVKSYGNEVTGAKAELICDVENDFDEEEVLGLRDKVLEELANENEYNTSGIFVIWDIEDDVATCEYVLFDDFVDVAEWDYRVISSVAANWLDMDFRM